MDHQVPGETSSENMKFMECIYVCFVEVQTAGKAPEFELVVKYRKLMRRGGRQQGSKEKEKN